MSHLPEEEETIQRVVLSGAPACEIVTIGTELLLGQIVDTNTIYLAEKLAGAGFSVRYRTSVGDRIEEIVGVLRTALSRCEMVITTGGLGPTLDDITREAVSRLSGVNLEYRQELMDQIEEIFRRAGYRMSENNRRQAFVPEGSHAIPNPVGTAPAFIKIVEGKPMICLPGVPRELKYLMEREVLPWLRTWFRLSQQKVTYRVLHAVGIAESKVDQLIGDLIRPGENPEVGLLASVGEIKIRIAAQAEDEKEARSLIDPVERTIKSRLGKTILGGDGATLEGAIDELLTFRGLTLAVLETFTGGMAAQRLHLLPSRRLLKSVVVPDVSQLASWMGLDHITPEEAMVSALAERVRTTAKAAVGLAILGFPSPLTDGMTLEGCAASVGEGGIRKSFFWRMGGDLITLRQRGAVIGLNTLRLSLLPTEGE
jgi:nicotinamide-nucleotide amidase